MGNFAVSVGKSYRELLAEFYLIYLFILIMLVMLCSSTLQSDGTHAQFRVVSQTTFYALSSVAQTRAYNCVAVWENSSEVTVANRQK